MRTMIALALILTFVAGPAAAQSGSTPAVEMSSEEKLSIAEGEKTIGEMKRAVRYIKFDRKARELWSGFSSSKNFHLFDNATAAYFFDMKQGEKLTGVLSSYWSYKFFSADIALIKTTEEDTSGFPAGGVSIDPAKLILRIPKLGSLMRKLGKKAPLLNYSKAGVWYARDFINHLDRGGYYVGLGRKF